MGLSSGLVQSILAGGWLRGEIYHVTALHRYSHDASSPHSQLQGILDAMGAGDMTFFSVLLMEMIGMTVVVAVFLIATLSLLG